MSTFLNSLFTLSAEIPTATAPSCSPVSENIGTNTRMEIPKVPSANDTCSFPFNAGPSSPQ